MKAKIVSIILLSVLLALLLVLSACDVMDLSIFNDTKEEDTTPFAFGSMNVIIIDPNTTTEDEITSVPKTEEKPKVTQDINTTAKQSEPLTSPVTAPQTEPVLTTTQLPVTTAPTQSCFHENTAWTQQEATCTQDAQRSLYCLTCGDVLQTQTVTATGHSFGDWSVMIEATEQTEGLEKRFCSDCNAFEERKIAKTDHIHTPETMPRVPATCTQDGHTEWVRCSTCHAVLVGHNPLISTGHLEGDDTRTVAEPTCQKEGLLYYLCQKCDEPLREKILPKLSHTANEGTITIPFTCTQDGWCVYNCIDCNDFMYEGPISAPGHIRRYDSEVESTCSKAGYRIFKCATCHEVLETLPQPLTPHENTIKLISLPTESSDGGIIVRCFNCLHTSDSTTVIKYRDYTNGFKYTVNEDSQSCTITGITQVSELLYIPPQIDGYTVTAIGDWAFADIFELNFVIFPDTMKSIGEYAFYNAGLMDIFIPNGVEYIGKMAFADTGLTYVTLPDSVNQTGDGLFAYCRILREIKLSNSMDRIGKWMFEDCIYLENVVLPSSIKVIAKEAFRNCQSIDSIDLPEGITVIENGAFMYCSGLVSITVPENITNISEETFMHCVSLSNVTLSNSLVSIGDRAFYHCLSLENITLPKTLKSIGLAAFQFDGGEMLTITFTGNPALWDLVSKDYEWRPENELYQVIFE